MGSRTDHVERGQVIVMLALLLPVLFGLGAVVIDVGNWYVHKRHLQTQVDAAALAAGLSLYGCVSDTATANANVAQQALAYVGDPTRHPPGAPISAQENAQVQAPVNVHAVLNSVSYWAPGTPTDGTGYDYTDVSSHPDAPRIGPAGMPCYNGYIDVKATDHDAPRLWGLLPFSTSPKAVARVELFEALTVKGVLPLGVPEVRPRWVAAIIVNEDAANWQTNPNAVRAAALLTQRSVPGLEAFTTYQGTLVGVNLNGAQRFGVFILTSQSSNPPSLSGSLDSICGQTPSPPAQVQCFAYDGGGTDVSFIHSYSASSPPPNVLDARLIGGCQDDLSAPYFNLEAGCPMFLETEINLGVPQGRDPRGNGYCYSVTSSPGGTMTWSSSGGGHGRWQSPSFTPSPGSGKNSVTLTIERRQNLANCTGRTNTVATVPGVAAAYAADKHSGGIQYLWVSYNGQAANSVNQPTSADLVVTVGLQPPIVDAPHSDPPILFRLGRFNTPSQTQALDCNVSGAAGWREAIENGCQAWSVNERDGNCSTPWPNPAAPDCIDAENGNFTIGDAYRNRFIPQGCAANPNNWYRNGHTLPPVGDPRWAQLFVLDEAAFTVPGKRTYPVRRFVNVYVTAAEGLNCPGDDPPNAKRNELWGHVVSYAAIDPNATPSRTKCSFTDGGVCVPVLVR